MIRTQPGSPLFPYTTLFRSLLVDAELLQQLVAHVVAVGGAVGLQLSLIGAAELAAGDLAPLDFRDGVARRRVGAAAARSEEHTSELQSRFDLVCRLLLENKK